jgi:two-component system response regulator AtoC
MESYTNRTVFVVEDNKFYAAILKNELDSFCNHVTVFSSGEECLENLSRKPDLILLDYNLSEGMNGIEVLKKIKEYDDKLPVVFVSGNYKLNIVKDALRLGAEDFIDKPDSGLSMVESRLKDIFNLKTLEIEVKIKKIAKIAILVLFLFMIAIISLFFYFSCSF